MHIVPPEDRLDAPCDFSNAMGGIPFERLIEQSSRNDKPSNKAIRTKEKRLLSKRLSVSLMKTVAVSEINRSAIAIWFLQ